MFSAGSVVSMTEEGQVTHVSMSLWERTGYFPSPDGLFEWTIPRHPDITGLLFRTEVIEHVGSLDPALLNADYDFEWRIISRYPVRRLERAVRRQRRARHAGHPDERRGRVAPELPHDARPPGDQ